MSKKIIVFEDDFRLLSALIEILNLSNFEIIAGFDSYEEYRKNDGSKLSFDIALIDIRLNGISGIDIISKLKSINPFLKVIMLSNESDPNTVYDAFINGADGYLLKIDAITNLGFYLTQLDSFQHVVSNSITAVLVKIIRNVPAKQFTNRPDIKLTKAQHRVLHKLLGGLTYDEIGSELSISPHTVSQHVQKIYRAYNVNSRNELYNIS